MSLSEQIKATLSLVDEFRADGHELRKVGSRFVCLCPFHKEKSPSCYVSDRFHCFACAADGSVIDYRALKRGITPAEAIKELAERLRIPSERSGTNSHVETDKTPDPVPPKSRSPLRLPDLQKGSPTELARLAERRRLSIDAVKLVSNRGFLWFVTRRGQRAWILTDRTRRNAQARRCDGEVWSHIGGKKAWTLPSSQATWPIGIEEARRYECVALLEGGPDSLAALHFLISEGRENAVAPVAILGTGNRIPADALKLFAGKRVRLFPHSDSNDAGLRAAANWEAQLQSIVERIDAFDFSGLRQSGGAPVQDLNDLTNVDVDGIEAERALLSIMNF